MLQLPRDSGAGRKHGPGPQQHRWQPAASAKDLFYLGNEATTVLLKNGQTLQGVAKNRSNYSIQLVDAKGILHLIEMNDVKQLTLSASTPMPTDYAKRLSKDELRDLLAYLAAQDLRAEERKETNR
jgi:putative heme-binding domain-containing protein